MPSACQGHYALNKEQCEVAQSLWATKFNYCCPDFALNFQSMPKGGWKINDPGAFGSFSPSCLAGGVSEFSTGSGVTTAPPTGLINGLKWVGEGCGSNRRERMATGGCKGFWCVSFRAEERSRCSNSFCFTYAGTVQACQGARRPVSCRVLAFTLCVFEAYPFGLFALF